jgi:hypothetical protein
MEQAQAVAAFMSAKPPKLTDLLIDVDAKPSSKASWQEIKAAMIVAFPPTRPAPQ